VRVFLQLRRGSQNIRVGSGSRTRCAMHEEASLDSAFKTFAGERSPHPAEQPQRRARAPPEPGSRAAPAQLHPSEAIWWSVVGTDDFKAELGEIPVPEWLPVERRHRRLGFQCGAWIRAWAPLPQSSSITSPRSANRSSTTGLRAGGGRPPELVGTLISPEALLALDGELLDVAVVRAGLAHKSARSHGETHRSYPGTCCPRWLASLHCRADQAPCPPAPITAVVGRHGDLLPSRLANAAAPRRCRRSAWKVDHVADLSAPHHPFK